MTNFLADDDTIERLLAGRTSVDLEMLSAFIGGVRSIGTSPPRPSPLLVEFIASQTANEPAPAFRTGGRRGLGGGLAKLTPAAAWVRQALGGATKGLSTVAVAVAGVAVAGLAVAGVVGALPTSQAEFDDIVHAVVPSTRPAPSPATAPSAPSQFGRSTSNDAKDGGVDGRELSERAKSNGSRPVGAGAPSPTPQHRSGKPTAPPETSQRPSERPTPHASRPPTPL